MNQPKAHEKKGWNLKPLLWRMRAGIKLRALLILKSLGMLSWLNLHVPIA